MRFALAALLAALAVGSANAGIIATASYNGHTYHLLTTNSWTASEAEAVSLGGHLVTINDAAENLFLYNTWGGGSASPRSLWIGFTDVGTASSTDAIFRWVSGQPVTYTNWNSGEPNDAGGEDYAHMLTFGGNSITGGVWNDLDDAGQFGGNYDGNKFGVVEIAPTPEPVSLVVFGGLVLGGAGIALRRRMAKAAM